MKPILFLPCLVLAACGRSDPDPDAYANSSVPTYVHDSSSVNYVPDNTTATYSTDVGVTYQSGSLPSALNPFATGHSCPAPVLNGSAEQRACFEAAQKICPEGKSPDHPDFQRREDGQYVINGYACA